MAELHKDSSNVWPFFSSRFGLSISGRQTVLIRKRPGFETFFAFSADEAGYRGESEAAAHGEFVGKGEIEMEEA